MIGLAFVLPFLLFVAFPSRMWNFDGVACAAALELGRPLFLFHSNHLLYGFLGFIFWRGLAPWAIPRSLPALQLFTSLLSAGGLMGLFFMLHGVLRDKRQALLLTLSIAASAVVWVWSVEAQVYALGFIALAWATVCLLQPDSPGKWTSVGVLHAGAVLGHVVHVLWLIPALFWLFHERQGRWKTAMKPYLLWLITLTTLPYLAVIFGLVVPLHWNDRWLWKWILGSAALNPTSVFQWHVSGWQGPLEWAGTTLHIFWGSFWPYATATPSWGWGLTGLSGVIIGLLMACSWKERRSRLWIFAAIWLAVYGVFFWTWEPRMECYRMTDVIPLALMLALGLKTIHDKRWALGLPAVLLGTLLPLNFVTRIAPMHEAQRNTLYQEVVQLDQATPAHSLYLTGGGMPWIYLLYFSNRAAWNLNSFARDPEKLRQEIARHVRNQPVFIRNDAMLSVLVASALNRYKQRPVSPGLPWTQLQ